MPIRDSEPVASLQLWKELEQLARDAEWALNKKLIDYFLGRSAEPGPKDFAVATQARSLANRHYAQLFRSPARRETRSSRSDAATPRLPHGTA